MTTIYVIVGERGPVLRTKSGSIMAYASRDAAVRARSFCNSVVEYVPRDAASAHDATSERARDDANARGEALSVALITIAAYREALGANRSESDGDVIARARRMRRAIDEIQALRIERSADSGASEAPKEET